MPFTEVILILMSTNMFFSWTRCCVKSTMHPKLQTTILLNNLSNCWNFDSDFLVKLEMTSELDHVQLRMSFRRDISWWTQNPLNPFELNYICHVPPECLSPVLLNMSKDVTGCLLLNFAVQVMPWLSRTSCICHCLCHSPAERITSNFLPNIGHS